MVFTEALIAQERVNGMLVTEALLTQQAIASLLDKKAAKAFSGTIKSLSDG